MRIGSEGSECEESDLGLERRRCGGEVWRDRVKWCSADAVKVGGVVVRGEDLEEVEEGGIGIAELLDAVGGCDRSEVEDGGVG